MKYLILGRFCTNPLPHFLSTSVPKAVLILLSAIHQGQVFFLFCFSLLLHPQKPPAPDCKDTQKTKQNLCKNRLPEQVEDTSLGKVSNTSNFIF